MFIVQGSGDDTDDAHVNVDANAAAGDANVDAAASDGHPLWTMFNRSPQGVWNLSISMQSL